MLLLLYVIDEVLLLLHLKYLNSSSMSGGNCAPARVCSICRVYKSLSRGPRSLSEDEDCDAKPLHKVPSADDQPRVYYQRVTVNLDWNRWVPSIIDIYLLLFAKF